MSSNRWIEWVKKWAADHNTTYSSALSQPECKNSYRAKYGVSKKLPVKKKGTMIGGSRTPRLEEINRVREIMKDDDEYTRYLQNVYRMSKNQIAKAFSFICIEILPETNENVLIDQDTVRRWIRKAIVER